MKKMKRNQTKSKPAAKPRRRSSPGRIAGARQPSGRGSLDAAIAELGAIAGELRETARNLQALLERQAVEEPGEVAAVVITESEEPEGFER